MPQQNVSHYHTTFARLLLIYFLTSYSSYDNESPLLIICKRIIISFLIVFTLKIIELINY